jgi:hypothetical protein
MQKYFMRKHSQWCQRLTIFITLLLFRPLVGAQEEPTGDAASRLREARLAIEVAENRYLEANAELLSTRKELERVRTRLAESQVALARLSEEITALRLQAANLLVNPEDTQAAGALAQASREFEEVHGLAQDLYRQLLDYQRGVEAALELQAAPPDSPMRQLLSGRLAIALKKVQEIDRLSGGGPSKLAGNRDECRILSLNEALGVVVLDQGREQGAKPGAQWIGGGTEPEIRLQIVEVRAGLSAATLLNGRWQDLRPGMTLARQQEPRPSESSRP